MKDIEFYQFTEALMQKIEHFIDCYVKETDEDIDYELHGNVMTITLPSQRKIIINTQKPLSQIWMATHQQGYHFDYYQKSWYCHRSQQEFMNILARALKNQA